MVANEELLADAEVDEFDLLGLGVVQNVFWLDVSVAHSFGVDVLQSFEQLLHDHFQVFFPHRATLPQTGHGFVVHDQAGGVLAEVEVNGVVLDDVGMIEGPDGLEVVLQVGPVFFVDGHEFDGIGFLGALMKALPDNAIGPFSNFLSHLIVLLKHGQVGCRCFLVFIRIIFHIIALDGGFPV